MSNMITFGCTSIKNLSKRGVINVDSHGRYEIVVGGLDVYNSVGQKYVRREAEDLFMNSSAFMRRVNRGACYGELGHPKQLPGMSEKEYLKRLLSIYEDNICCQHQEFILDFDRVKDKEGNKVCAIISRMVPSGPHGPALQKSMETEGENVCFSIRAFTDDEYRNGVYERILRTIITFDRVTEPGISFAEKFMSPSCEARMDDFDNHSFSRATLESLQTDLLGARHVAQESTIMLTATELFDSMGWGVDKRDRPAFARWGQ